MNSRRALTLSFALSLIFACQCGREQATPSPTGAVSLGMAFDPLRGRLVVYGGFLSGETWEYR